MSPDGLAHQDPHLQTSFGTEYSSIFKKALQALPNSQALLKTFAWLCATDWNEKQNSAAKQRWKENKETKT